MFEDLTSVKVGIVILITMVVQDVLLSQIVIFGSHPDAMVLLPITAGIYGGAEIGALVGFAAGIAADLLVATPFGLSAVVFVLLGYGIGAFVASPLGHDFAIARLFGSFAGSLAGTLFFALVAAVIGQPGVFTFHLLSTLLAVGLGGLVLSPLLYAVWQWALADLQRSLGGARMPSGGSAVR